ncbi:MAG: hypothetical protein HQK49_09490 [Oligoflexia bacterium]|nr:hypothetical protein [Oligoflexia bacterium]
MIIEMRSFVFIFIFSILSFNFTYASNFPSTPLAVKFLETVNSCGTLSPNTVPDNWGVAAVRGGGEGKSCVTWIPPFWQSYYFGDGGSVFYGPAASNLQNFSASFMTGVPYGLYNCTPAGYTQWYLQLVASSGCVNPTIESYSEQMMDFAGVQMPTAIFVYSCNKSGVKLVGGVLAGVTQSVLCSSFSLNYQLPEANINQASICSLAQIVSAEKCYQNGQYICEKPKCSATCIAQGNSIGGHCDSFEQCVCHPKL